MKYSFIALILLASSSVQASTTIDGFCVLEVFQLREATHVNANSRNLRGKVKAFHKRAVKNALKTYRSQLEVDDKIFVDSAKLVYGLRDDSETKKDFLGVILELSMHGDEDVVTFYYFRDDSEPSSPKLKMYLHDNQSATAHFVCDY